MSVLAVAVTFNPDTALLGEVLRAVTSQVQGVVVVDNGSGNVGQIQEAVTAAGARILANPGNLGIATAQNQGIEYARKSGFSHVLLLDQDTILSEGVVARLSDDLEVLQKSGTKVAAIGPAYFERHSGQQTRAYRSSGPRIARIGLKAETAPVATDFIIASGSLIPLKVLDEIGGFKEELFIDLVDVEWCFRARAAGYGAFISPRAVVDHHLGSGTLKIGSRQVAVHTPVRNYYWVRNALWLARQSYTPLAWRLYCLSRSLAFIATYPTLADRRGLRLKLIGRGIWDSLTGRFGGLSR